MVNNIRKQNQSLRKMYQSFKLLPLQCSLWLNNCFVLSHWNCIGQRNARQHSNKIVFIDDLITWSSRWTHGVFLLTLMCINTGLIHPTVWHISNQGIAINISKQWKVIEPLSVSLDPVWYRMHFKGIWLCISFKQKHFSHKFQINLSDAVVISLFICSNDPEQG